MKVAPLYLIGFKKRYYLVSVDKKSVTGRNALNIRPYLSVSLGIDYCHILLPDTKTVILPRKCAVVLFSSILYAVDAMLMWRFRNFSFYPSIAPTGLVRAEDSLETETRFKEKRRK